MTYDAETIGYAEDGTRFRIIDRPPPNLTAHGDTPSTITLVWDPTGPVATYAVYRRSCDTTPDLSSPFDATLAVERAVAVVDTPVYRDTPPDPAAVWQYQVFTVERLPDRDDR